MGSIMSSMSNQVLSIIEKKNGQNNYFEEEITIEERSKYLFFALQHDVTIWICFKSF